MKRRRFLQLTGLGLSASLAWPKLAGGSEIDPRLSPAGAESNAKAYGSGYFGEWITDKFGLPAYRYTCDQTTDPKAVSPVHKEWRSPTDQIHQVGNNRLVAAVSNYGYVQVRQDEGSPKFLNDYFPEQNRYGAGIGFLADEDGDAILSTYYSGDGNSFGRIFGMGYFRKRVTGARYEVDQAIVAPFGDDPVLISQVTITNRSKDRRQPRWVEYWGCENYQFSYRSGMEARVAGGATKTPALRREFAARFAHRFEVVHDGAGLLERQTFFGRSAKEEQEWQEVQARRAKSTGASRGPVPTPAPGASMEDLHPPATFLVSLDGYADGFATNAADFFRGGIEQPAGMAAELGNNLSANGPESAFFLERRLSLDPGESRTLHFLYGYLPAGFQLDGLIGKYRAGVASHWARSSAQWKQDGIRLRVKSEPWVERETSWHSYYLRSGLTYDSFFREHILSQGNIYQYLDGIQAAARDPLQSILPFVFSDPAMVRQVIRYTLKEIPPDGVIPYGIVGSGVPMPASFIPSDLNLWLLWAASEYVLATRDTDFLEEKIPVYPHQEAGDRDLTVRALLARSYEYLMTRIGTGEHGLLRLSNGDWNDAVVFGQVPPQLEAEVRRTAESVLNAAMACYVLDFYAAMLRFTGDVPLAAEAHEKAEAQRQAVRAQWTGRWFRRAWLGEHLGWIGEKEMWLEPQPWAIVGGAATVGERPVLVTAINDLIRKPSPIGAMLLSQGSQKMDRPVGVMENGGVWIAINGTLIWALAQVNGTMAWNEWRKNSLARHAAIYPDIWYGIWSGPDSYNSALSRHPGATQFADPSSPNPKARVDYGMNYTDYPVMNMDLHGWLLYSTAKLLGLEFHEKGLDLRPDLPMAEYEFTSHLLGFKKSKNGYSGWYAPLKGGRWQIAIQLPQADRNRFRRLHVNGLPEPLKETDRGMVFSGESRPGEPLKWEIA